MAGGGGLRELRRDAGDGEDDREALGVSDFFSDEGWAVCEQHPAGGAAHGPAGRPAPRPGSACGAAGRAAGLIAAAALPCALAVAALWRACREDHGTWPPRAALGAGIIAAAAVPSPSTSGNWWDTVPSADLLTTTTVAGQSTTPTADWFVLLGGGEKGSALAPLENLDDDNLCSDDEEQHLELCYKKCEILTKGEYPFRTSAWTCCKSKPCTLFNQVHNAGICSGFDVAGDVNGQKACPHAPGSCLQNEELYMGMCYKKCSLLVPEYPKRFAASTCCKVSGVTCFTTQGVTDPSYAVGGGGGDGDPETPAEVHKPLLQLTAASA